MIRRATECEKNSHRLVPAGRVGGGLSRVRCEVCGAVQIGLVDDAPVTSVSAKLRAVAESRSGGTRDVDLLVRSPDHGDLLRIDIDAD